MTERASRTSSGPRRPTRRAALPYRLAARALHPAAHTVAAPPASGASPDVAGYRNVLLVSFRRDGRPVSTPVWFAPVGDLLYARSEAGAAKVKRIRRDDRVLVAPCDGRGQPLGPAFHAAARVLGCDETTAAERALASRYGVLRRVFELLFFRGRDFAYLEMRPTPGPAAAVAASPEGTRQAGA